MLLKRKPKRERYFENLKSFGFLKGLSDELRALWVRHGKPELPGGAGTEAHLPGAIITDLESMGEGATEEDKEALNEAIEAIYNCVGYSYIGSGIWYTAWEPGTDEWCEYQAEAENVIQEYRNFCLWDAFCASRW